MLTNDEALAVAKRHGLTVADAAGLQRMAGSVDEAERLAESYNSPAQMTREDVRQLYREGRHEDILKAQREGRLAELLGQTPKPTKPAPKADAGSGHQLTREQLKTMSPEDILAAREAGQLAKLLGHPYVETEE